ECAAPLARVVLQGEEKQAFGDGEVVGGHVRLSRSLGKGREYAEHVKCGWLIRPGRWLALRPVLSGICAADRACRPGPDGRRGRLPSARASVSGFRLATSRAC